MNPNNLPAKRPDDELTPIRNALEANKANLLALLPKTFNMKRFFAVVGNSCRKTPALLRCDPASLFQAVRKSAEIGLEPDTELGHGYLVPFGKEVTFIPGYRGFIYKVFRCAGISLCAVLVYKDDVFEMEEGDNPHVRHVLNLEGDRSNAAIVYVYARARYPDGHYEVGTPMTRAEVENVRLSSKSGKSEYSPWQKHYPEMVKKTAIRRHAKVLPISNEEYQKLLEVDNEDFVSNRVLEVGQARKTLNLNEDPPEQAPEPKETPPPPSKDKPSDKYYGEDPGSSRERQPGEDG